MVRPIYIDVEDSHVMFRKIHGYHLVLRIHRTAARIILDFGTRKPPSHFLE
jgi:hypothetical protein